MASLAAHIRPFTCLAASQSSRLAPHLADLVRWIKREGGFVHHVVKLSQDTPFGVSLISTKKIREGTDLISLPPHVPLRFESDDAPSSSLLAALARRGPGDLRNSFSVVWEGRHLVHGTVVAIKEIAMSRLNKKLQDSLMSEIFTLRRSIIPTSSALST